MNNKNVFIPIQLKTLCQSLLKSLIQPNRWLLDIKRPHKEETQYRSTGFPTTSHKSFNKGTNIIGGMSARQYPSPRSGSRLGYWGKNLEQGQ